MTDKPLLTEEGYNELLEEVEERKEEVRELGQEKGRVAGYGDLRENAEHDATAKNYRLKNESLKELEKLVGTAKVVTKDVIPEDKVAFGTTVVVRELEKDETHTYRLVSKHEADTSSNDIFYNSPVAQGLLGKEIGDVAEVETPKGEKSYRIEDILLDKDF